MPQLAGLHQPVQGLSVAGPASAPALKGLPFNQVPCEPVVWAMAQLMEWVLYVRQCSFYLGTFCERTRCVRMSLQVRDTYVVLLNSIISLLLKPYKILQTSCVIKLNLQNSKPLGKKGPGTQSPLLRIGEEDGEKGLDVGRTPQPSAFRELASWRAGVGLIVQVGTRTQMWTEWCSAAGPSSSYKQTPLVPEVNVGAQVKVFLLGTQGACK